MHPLYTFANPAPDAPVLHLAVANGFPPSTYRPLLQPFTESHRILSLLPRALWDDHTPPPDEIIDWKDGVAQDLLTGYRQHNLSDIIAIGHSFGGIASALNVIEDPQRFKALVLLDPTLLTPEVWAMMATLHAQNQLDLMPLAARAIKRQRDFASTEAVFAYFRDKPLFANWSDEVLRLYAEGGTRPTPDGVTLAWSPEWEAYYFKTGYTKIWETLPQLNGLVPTLIIRGTSSDAYVEAAQAQVKTLLPDAEHVEIDGGHLFPQERPAETAAIIDSWLHSKGLR